MQNDTCNGQKAKKRECVKKEAGNERGTILTLWHEHHTTEDTSRQLIARFVSLDMPFSCFGRKKKNARTSVGIAIGTAIGAASNTVTGTATGSTLTDVGLATTAAAAPHKTIPEVSEVGCTVIYEEEGPIQAE
jgi:hypothetical protein